MGAVKGAQEAAGVCGHGPVSPGPRGEGGAGAACPPGLQSGFLLRSALADLPGSPLCTQLTSSGAHPALRADVCVDNRASPPPNSGSGQTSGGLHFPMPSPCPEGNQGGTLSNSESVSLR